MAKAKKIYAVQKTDGSFLLDYNNVPWLFGTKSDANSEAKFHNDENGLKGAAKAKSVEVTVTPNVIAPVAA